MLKIMPVMQGFTSHAQPIKLIQIVNLRFFLELNYIIGTVT